LGTLSSPLFILGALSLLCIACAILSLGERIGAAEGCLDWTTDWTGLVGSTLGKNLLVSPPLALFFILSISFWINSFFTLSSFRI
jgi:hypothetical protein